MNGYLFTVFNRYIIENVIWPSAKNQIPGPTIVFDKVKVFYNVPLQIKYSCATEMLLSTKSYSSDVWYR